LVRTARRGDEGKLTNSKVLQLRSQPDEEAQRLTTRLANLCSSIARPPYERHHSTRTTNASYIRDLQNKKYNTAKR